MDGQLRWRLAAEEDAGGQLRLFDEAGPRWRAGHGEFRGLEFLEVRAKRIINEVPAAARVPFRYTINVYRGCSHACVYCASGDTPVLMGDGRTKPLAEVAAGDRVYGTVRVGSDRRYVVTEVLDHWSTVKPAYRVVLEDGTELVVSGDHRLLTDRGWKHVTGSQQGRSLRPHLTVNHKLMGTGTFAEAPEHDPEYRLGYRCGMIRGDGALVDLEALQRSRSFLVTVPDAGWPREPSVQWNKGFLAGIFDAEGSYRRGNLRIANTNPLITRQVVACLQRLGFPYALEPRDRGHASVNVSIGGGLPVHLRFFHTVDPAITRKRSIEGTAVTGNAPLRIVAIEPLGLELPLYDITTGTGDFIANGVVSHNCFARPTHEYLNLGAGEDFERKIVVKINAVERVRAELASKRWAGDPIAMGTNTDPYQRCEGNYGLTRGVVEALSEARNPFSILTKSTLILRDLDVLAEAAGRTAVQAALSIGTLDEDVWRMSEPGTPHPRRRVEAVARLNAAGVPTGVLVAPILPGLSDGPGLIEAVAEACAAAGATSISGIPLHLRRGVREEFMPWLAAVRPDLVPVYERLYVRPYADRRVGEEVSARIQAGAGRSPAPDRETTSPSSG